MIRNVFESILMDMKNPDLPDRRMFKYALPRQVGASTFLINVANEKASKGESVLFVAFNGSWKGHLKKVLHPLVTTTIPSRNLELYIQKWDLVICDSISLRAPSEEWLKILEEQSKRILWIDTDEGTVY